MTSPTCIPPAELLTPFKYGTPVLAASGSAGAFDEKAVDCPFVFRHQDQFYMMYVGFNGDGYQTALATSGDLLNWTPLAVILREEDGHGWDSGNAAGCWILRHNELLNPPTLKKWDNKYWLAYHSYPGVGYEAGPARIGLAWTEDESLLTWNRLPEPILIPEDGAPWEQGGLYKECLLEHEGTFYLFYNAKNRVGSSESWKEQTGLATSTDLLHWSRHRDNPLVKVSEGWDALFVSDPCVLRHDNTWVMYYFGYDGLHAQEGIAFSDDLVHWHKHPEPIVPIGEPGSLDSLHAHKPSVIAHNGVLYHFYTACRPHEPGDSTSSFDYRTITFAASQPIEE